MNILGLGFGWSNPFPPRRFRCPKAEGGRSLNSDAPTSKNGGTGWALRFPLGPSATSSSLALAGDTIAQIIERSKIKRREPLTHERNPNKDFKWDFLCNHDWLRALRMASYGFLLYGPGSYAWYQLLDHYMPKQTLATLSAKFVAGEAIRTPHKVSERCPSYTAHWFEVLDTGQHTEFRGCASSGPGSLHVRLLHILEFLFVKHHE